MASDLMTLVWMGRKEKLNLRWVDTVPRILKHRDVGATCAFNATGRGGGRLRWISSFEEKLISPIFSGVGGGDVVINFDRSRDGNLENFHGPKLRNSSGNL